MRKQRIFIILMVAAITLGLVLYSKVKFSRHNGYEGIYFFKGANGFWLEVSDDLFPEESHRLLWGMPIVQMKNVESSGACAASNSPCTSYEWNTKTGRGFIKVLYPDGKKLVINLGRFLDSLSQPVSGLFIGGGLPPGDPDFAMFNKNETGMAYYDGNRYFHIWCNVNEGIIDAAAQPIYPSQWQFVSSDVLKSSLNDLTLVSRHLVQINKVPVTVERYLFHQLGNHYVTLTTMFKNVGSVPTTFGYVYGDEPWVGDYGSSAGNVGWLADGLVLTERDIDTSRYSYAGLFDFGNPLAGEHHEFYTQKANFIEWDPKTKPDLAYFANQFGGLDAGKTNVPLNNPLSRVIALEWKQKILFPGQTSSFTISVGMADNDPKTGLPEKPDTSLY